SLKVLAGRPSAPDVLDLKPTFAADGASDGLFAPYRGLHWDTVPTDLREPNGYWVGDYWSAVAFGTNLRHAKEAPTAWKDLTAPEYLGKIVIGTDPRELGSGFAAVLAASLAKGG